MIDQDERHSSSEVLRELGGIYVAARQFADARHELEIYTERRPYDPEGLYYYGQALEGLGETAAARDAYARAVEADRTAPRYRRRFTARWSRSRRSVRCRLTATKYKSPAEPPVEGRGGAFSPNKADITSRRAWRQRAGVFTVFLAAFL